MDDRLPEAIFLDLDDTIIDDSSSVDSGWRTAIAQFAAQSGLDVDAVHASVSEIRNWYWADPERHRQGRADLRRTSTWIVAEALSRVAAPDPQLASLIANYYRDLREFGQELLPGALDAIEGLRAQGIRLALITNGAATVQRSKIERFALAQHFDYICVEGEFGCGKPDERVYRAAVDAVRCRPETTWMVGDNLELDVAAPMRLGLTGIWFDRFSTGLPSTTAVRPDRVIRSLSELLSAS